jgi:hypothetical protein
MRPTHTLNHASAFTGRRVVTFKAYLKMGGTAGMVRRIIAGWKHPFNVNQMKVTFHRRHPEIIPADRQIDDILAFMAERRQLVRLADGSYQRPHFPAV